MMRAKSSAFRLAPPTSAPSMSGWPSRSAAFSGLHDPPYWMRTARRSQAGELRSSHGSARALLRLSGRCRLPGADGPDGLVGDGAPAIASASRPANTPRTWRETTSQVRFESRSWSVCPTQTMGWSFASRAARSLRFTVSSVSPKYCRRSLCPRITPSQPSRPAWRLTSPVKAPCFLVVAVLREELDRRPLQRLLHRRSAVYAEPRPPAPRSSPSPQLPHHLHRLGAGLVHLPVATNESPPRHSSSTLRPGRSRPSRNSREAPPPVRRG